MPVAALLNGSGIGELIRKYIYVGRKEGDDGPNERSENERPRVQVTGPKVKPLICQICLGRIKEGSEFVKCSSGKVFHSVCLTRVGSCPFCQSHYAVRGEHGLVGVPITTSWSPPASPRAQETSFPPQPEMAPVERTLPCPVCGMAITEEAEACACGAIFVIEGGMFKCPSCAASITEGDVFCNQCGERFYRVRPRACPACGKSIPANSDTCDCGVILSDNCPECGSELGVNDSTCVNCGAEFDFL